MNYIGSKYTLINFITEVVRETLLLNNECRQTHEMIFADLFSGTSIVGGKFKEQGYSIIANDIQFYSYIITKHTIENNGNLDKSRCEKLVNELNSLEGKEGFIYCNYSMGGTIGQQYNRMYFSDYNAKKCDAIRSTLDEWLKNEKISISEYYFLLGSLLDSVDKCANTALVYGAYLKHLKSKAQKDMQLVGLPIIKGKVPCHVYNEDACELIKKIKGDILYLDPPYNDRQYCSNYHLLETIARNDDPTIHGKTGLRDYFDQKSSFCSKKLAVKALENIVERAQFKYIFLSYNNEGIIPLNKIEEIFKKYGTYSVYTKEYHRFKSDKDQNRNHKARKTTEYIHCLVKSTGMQMKED